MPWSPRLARWPAALSRPGAVAAAIVVLALALLAGGCGSRVRRRRRRRLEVVATTTQIGDWAREVGGTAVSVDQILQPNTDPHEYEPRPSDVEAAAGAKLVFANGDNLDRWIDQVVSDSGSDAEVVDLGAAVPDRLPGRVERARRRPSTTRTGGTTPATPRPRCARSSAGLAAADPVQRREFERNADAYLGRAASARPRGSPRCIDSVPAARRKLVTDHDAFGYFAHRYGIEVVGAVIPSQTTQAQPSAKDLSELAKTIEARG